MLDLLNWLHQFREPVNLNPPWADTAIHRDTRTRVLVTGWDSELVVMRAPEKYYTLSSVNRPRYAAMNFDNNVRDGMDFSGTAPVRYCIGTSTEQVLEYLAGALEQPTTLAPRVPR